jgi:hypothetical protein
MKSMHRPHVQRGTSRPSSRRRVKATVPPRRRRRPRPTPQPAPEPTSAARGGRLWKPVRPTAQRAYEVELFTEID